MVIKLNSDGIPEGNPITDANFRAMFADQRIGTALTPAITEPLGYGMYSKTSQPILLENQRYKKVTEAAPIKNSLTGYWVQEWEIVDQTADEMIATDNKQKDKIRVQRTAKLMQCDWTDLPNTPLSTEKKTEWINYRQSLRDITSQQGFPWDVAWPTIPY